MSANIKPTTDLRMIPLGLFSIGLGLFVVGGVLYGAVPDAGPFIAFGLVTAALGSPITGFGRFAQTTFLAA